MHMVFIMLHTYTHDEPVVDPPSRQPAKPATMKNEGWDATFIAVGISCVCVIVAYQFRLMMTRGREEGASGDGLYGGREGRISRLLYEYDSKMLPPKTGKSYVVIGGE